MVYVERQEGENIDQLVKRFGHAIMQSGVIAEFRRRQSFQTPTERKRAKRAAAAQRRAQARRRHQTWLERAERRGF